MFSFLHTSRSEVEELLRSLISKPKELLSDSCLDGLMKYGDSIKRCHMMWQEIGVSSISSLGASRQVSQFNSTNVLSAISSHSTQGYSPSQSVPGDQESEYSFCCIYRLRISLLACAPRRCGREGRTRRCAGYTVSIF